MRIMQLNLKLLKYRRDISDPEFESWELEKFLNMINSSRFEFVQVLRLIMKNVLFGWKGENARNLLSAWEVR